MKKTFTPADIKRKHFRERLAAPEIVVAPGCFDAFSASLVEYAGFESLYMTGAGVSASVLGAPDVGLLTMNEMVGTASRIVEAVDIPLIADADTGYGGPLNVMRTVRMYEKAGACAIHLEDQEMPKRCGHLAGKSVVSRQRMLDRIKAALEARTDPNFLIIARTDARAVLGFDEALERARLCAEAGADVIFVEAPESEDEMRIVCRSFPDIPKLINRGGGDKTPHLGARELEDLGYDMAIFPGDAQKIAGKAMLEVYRTLKETGNTESLQGRMMGFDERFELLGLSTFRELETRYPGDKE